METIDRTAMFLQHIDNNRTLLINGNNVVVRKEMSNTLNGKIIIETDFQTLVVFPFIDGNNGFVIEYLDISFLAKINIPMNDNQTCKIVVEQFYKILIKSLLKDLHKYI